MKILLFLGVLVYFGSRWILSRRKNEIGNGKIFFSYMLYLAEIATIFAVTGQLLYNIIEWDLPKVARLIGLILFVSGTLLSVYSRFALGDAYSMARKFLKPNHLVQRGPYRYIRHPIYSSTFLMGLGFELAIASYLFFIVLILGAIVIYFCAREEEKRLKIWFPQYKDYQERTKKFIPFIF